MNMYRIDLFNMEITVFTLSIIIVMSKLSSYLLKKLGYSSHVKLLNLLEIQPYKVASLIILTYLLVNNIGIPTAKYTILGHNLVYHMFYMVQIIRYVLTIFLIYKLEQTFYCWIKSHASEFENLALIMISIRNSFRLFLFSILLPLLMPNFILLPKLEYTLYVLTTTLIIWSLAWLIIRSIAVAEEIYLNNHPDFKISDYHARGVATQTRIFRKIIVIIVIIIAIAATCLIFESARAFGTSILASAGIATGILGFAANKIIANFFAGIQIAITKPIKINDLVKVSGEYGAIEDISLTYVVIKLWDQRHLIVPINHFIEEKFYNYSLNSTARTSIIIFYADYNVPVAEIRKYFSEIVNESEFYDHKSMALQVINFDNKTLKFRGTATVRNSPDAWSLKCEVIEKLASIFMTKYPNSLPKIRFEEIDK